MRRPILGLMLPTIANTDSGRIEPSRLLEAARRAARGGFDGLYVGDHLLHPGPLLEALVSLAAVAAITDRLSIGPCVLLPALRHPLWLAKQLGTIESFAPGRLRIGIGVGGEYPQEFEAMGIPLADRGRRTEQVIEQLREILSGSNTFFTGTNSVDVTIAPLPDEHVPLLLGGWKEVALKRAAAIADGWIGYLLSVESFSKRRNFLLKARLPERGVPFITGMLLPVHVTSELEGAHTAAAAAWARVTKNGPALPDRLFIAGPPDAIVEQLYRYWQAGCSEIMLSIVDQGDRYLEQLDLLIGKILPQLHAFEIQLNQMG